MQTMGISQFKAHALRVLAQVAESQEAVIITKRGKPLAQILPYRSVDTNVEPGKLAHHLVFEKDIVSPLGEQMWNACK